MPFVSNAQRRWMWQHHPEMAREWESKTHGPLPDHVHHKGKKVKHKKGGKK